MVTALPPRTRSVAQPTLSRRRRLGSVHTIRHNPRSGLSTRRHARDDLGQSVDLASALALGPQGIHYDSDELEGKGSGDSESKGVDVHSVSVVV